MVVSTRLRFGAGNGKLPDFVVTFSLPSGRTCPGAKFCKAHARKRGKRYFLVPGKDAEFRCYSASEEVIFPSVYAARDANLQALKTVARGGRTYEARVNRLARFIRDQLPRPDWGVGLTVDGVEYAQIVRVHAAGDFWSQAYFDAWLEVARGCPDVLFYGYTKSIPYWQARLGVVPANLVLTASMGGEYDELARDLGLRTAEVVYSVAAAERLGLEIDHNDGHAMRRGPSFALLLHGVQPAGSDAAAAMREIKKSGEFGYGKKGKESRKLTLQMLEDMA